MPRYDVIGCLFLFEVLIAAVYFSALLFVNALIISRLSPSCTWTDFEVVTW